MRRMRAGIITDHAWQAGAGIIREATGYGSCRLPSDRPWAGCRSFITAAAISPDMERHFPFIVAVMTRDMGALWSTTSKTASAIQIKRPTVTNPYTGVGDA